MVPEAPFEREEQGGLVPRGEGWFVLNARDAAWLEGEFGAGTRFEGEPRFPQVGINIGVLQPGQPACMYHAEEAQEGFLVLDGECLLLIEGEERRLRAWDFVHCPAGTEHVFVGAGDGPCAILAVGARPTPSVVYPVSELARRHGAGVERTTTSPDEAYAPFAKDRPTAYRDGWLPGTDAGTSSSR
ncbi:MAG TPA: cupin domain-containing protein [Gaiellaceae bacterium]|nr:cupin domain-containing protein [Gaiellaceae bacterium]